MSTTVYTYNNKVLKNVATDKWLKKAEAIPSSIVSFYTHSEPIETAYNGTITSNVNVDISSRDFFVIKFDVAWPADQSTYKVGINLNNVSWSGRLNNSDIGNHAPVLESSSQVQIIDNNVTYSEMFGYHYYNTNISGFNSTSYYKLIYQLSTGEMHVFLKYTQSGPYVEQVVANKTSGANTFTSISINTESMYGNGIQVLNISAAGANTYQECLDY